MRASPFLLAVILLCTAPPTLARAARSAPGDSEALEVPGPAKARKAKRVSVVEESDDDDAPRVRKGKRGRGEAMAEKRELRHRTLTLDDATLASLPELHVAGGQATIITFQERVKDEGAILGQVGGLFYKPAQTDKTVIVIPKVDLKGPVPLNITLLDGTVLSFKLVSAPLDADVQVDVLLALQRRAPPDSAAALKGTIGQLQGQLDECKANSVNAGAARLASLLLNQSLDAPQAFERHTLRKTSKNDRLLLEAKWAYRVVGLTYVVLVVENRDPDRPWVLDRAEVRFASGAQASEVKVLTAQSEVQNLLPGDPERVVVGFQTPSQATNPTVTLTLYEKDGGRRAVLEKLEL